MNIEDIKKAIIPVPDFPEKGVVFQDISPLFLNHELINFIVYTFYQSVKELQFDVIVAAESRGFLIGLPLSLKMNKPFVMVRKKGKLPRKTISIDYDLEYGSSTLEMHEDSIKPKQRVLIIDDLIATGGTSLAIEKLVEKLGGKIAGHAYLIELENFQGRKKVKGSFYSMLKY